MLRTATGNGATMIDEEGEDGPAPQLLRTLSDLAERFEDRDASGRTTWHCWGSGPALVLLHGGTGSWRHWARNIAVLALRYRVIAPDLPGMGESDTASGHDDPRAVAERLRRGLDRALGERASLDLVGFSFGGLIAGHLASRERGRTRSLTLVGTTGWPGLSVNAVPLVPVRGATPAARAAEHRANLARLMIADPGGVDDTAVWMQSWHARRLRIDTRRFYANGPLTAVIPVLGLPVNGIWGARDAIACPHVGERERLLRTLSPEGGFRQIEDAGHWVSYERPDAFNAALLELLSRPA